MAEHAALQDWDWVEGAPAIGSRRVDRLGLALPAFVYSGAVIRRRIARLRAALPASIRVHYAVKANPFGPLLQGIAPLVDGCDLASGGELQHALAHGFSAARMSMAGPGKSAADMLACIEQGACLTAESPQQVQQAIAIAQGRRPSLRLALRINPDYAVRGAGQRMGGQASPFGMDPEQAVVAARAALEKGVAIEGLHVYAASQMLDANAIAQQFELAASLCLRIQRESGATAQWFNLGGGLGVPYYAGEREVDLAAIGQALERCRLQAPMIELRIELGRYLAAEAGLYLVQVLETKTSMGKRFAITNGGLHHFSAATGNFGQVIRRNFPLGVCPGPDGEHATLEPPFDLVGPLCTPLDCLGRDVVLSAVQQGSVVFVARAGAYGPSASPVHFLGHPAPTEIFFDA
jgi:diaminopimelate decarboxylase